ncbi:MAG TPA: NUDIX domain-containing protein [archaeon]|nr:NUDIX domain-containing protein [archaeon]
MSDEKILVVERAKLLEKHFEGFMPIEGNENLLKIINEHGQFVPRSLVENDSSLKQIIPYIVFINNNKVFLMKRIAGEKRLHNLYTIGVGGHVNDLDGSLEAGMKREIDEEVEAEIKKIAPHGFINLEATPVDKVHFGVLYIAEADEIKIKEEKSLEDFGMVDIEEAKKLNLEGWSRVAADSL